MDRTQTVHKLEEIERRIKNCLEDLQACWGEFETLAAIPKPYMRMSDANNFLERAGNKIRKAITLFTGKKG